MRGQVPTQGQVLADRGIGGTGAPAVAGRASLVADRGIGGTGIIAVITGFGSVCVAGEEVALDAGVPVSIDAASADASALRAGQLVALEAGGASGGLAARSIAVRHEVSGPVEAVAPGRLRIAGQDVLITATTWIANPAQGVPPAKGAPSAKGVPPAVGDWIAVSGLRTPSGAIEATRLDPRPPGPVLVHGMLVRDGGRLMIGALPIAASPAARRLVGQEVTASGLLLGPELQADIVEPDRLATDPGGYFGIGVAALLVEGFVSSEGPGRLRIGRSIVRASGDFGTPHAAGRAVVMLGRTGDGRFEAMSVADQARRSTGEHGAIEHGPIEHGPMTPAPGPSRGTGPNGQRFDGIGGMNRAGSDGRPDGGRADGNRTDGSRGDGNRTDGSRFRYGPGDGGRPEGGGSRGPR